MRHWQGGDFASVYGEAGLSSVRVSTLYALERRGLVEAVEHRTAKKRHRPVAWKITDAGIALRELELVRGAMPDAHAEEQPPG